MKTKDKFKSLIREINFTFISIILFTTLLTSILIFLSVYLPLSLFNIGPVYALIPASLYFFIVTIKNIKKRHIIYLEKKYHLLDERLRTAEDNIADQNPVVGQLKDDLLNDIKFVSISSFFNEKRVSKNIFLIIVLCFLVVASSNIDFSFDLARITGATSNFIYRTGGDISGDRPSSLDDVPGRSDPYFANSSLSELGQEQLDFLVKSSAYKLNLDDFREPEQREFQDLFPDEAFTHAPEAYEERINEKHQDLVKAYFLNLAKQ